MANDHDGFGELIEASSLGSAGARQLRRRADPEAVDQVRASARPNRTESLIGPRRADRDRSEMMQQVGHTMDMIRELPRYAAYDSTVDLQGTVRVACLEAFLIHVRAVTDFLCCRPDARQSSDDFSARTFVPNWQPKPSDAAQQLRAAWVVASREIAHFSRDRLQANPEEPEFYDTSLAALQAIATAAEAVWQEFIEALGAQ